MEQATIAPVPKERPTKGNRTQGKGFYAERDEGHVGDTRLELMNDANAPRKYVGDRILRHAEEGDSVKYIVR